MTTLPTDVKELTPEFYCDPAFLVNARRLDFGTCASGAPPPLLRGSCSLLGARLGWSVACCSRAQLCCAAANHVLLINGRATTYMRIMYLRLPGSWYHTSEAIGFKQQRVEGQHDTERSSWNQVPGFRF